MKATFDNFHINTTGIFKYCDAPTTKPDYVSGISLYWHDHENNRVIRQSNHWGRRIRKCDWYLIDVEPDLCTTLPDGKIVTAYCSLDDLLCGKKNLLRRIMLKVTFNREFDERRKRRDERIERLLAA